jgi:DNA-binding SARP family transcriptional activator
MVRLEPFRETAYQLLMKTHAAAGDRAEALRVYARCREVLRDELGVDRRLRLKRCSWRFSGLSKCYRTRALRRFG